MELQVGGTLVKIRNPFGVFVLAIVTFGIYYFVWYYKVNRELRDAAGIDTSPVVALLAITIGWVIIVPPFISWYRTFKRIQQAQRQAGLANEASPMLGFILFLVALVLPARRVALRAGRVNKLWRAKSASS